LFVLVAFSPIKLSHAADLLPRQAEGGCSGGKVTSMHSSIHFSKPDPMLSSYGSLW